MMFNYGSYAREALCDVIPQIEKKILFLVGEHDWIERKEKDRLLNEGLLQPGSNVKTVPDSSHLPHVENAPFVAM